MNPLTLWIGRFGLCSCPLSIIGVALVFGDALPGLAQGALLAAGCGWLDLEAWLGMTREFRGETPSARWVSMSRGLWLLGPWLCGVDRTRQWTLMPLGSAGLVLVMLACAGALALRACAVLQLGQRFTYDITATDAHRLVDQGVYKHLRHPSYLGLIVLCIAPGLVFESLLGTLWLAATSIPQTLHRIAHEERALIRHFGTEYQRYCRRTGSLLPVRWRR